MINTFTKGMNLKSLTVTILAVFFWIFASDFLIHGIALKSQYQATASLWRSEAEMTNHMVWMILGQITIAKFIVLLFVHGYKGTGMGEGIRFGILIGFLFIGSYLIQYAVTPLTCSIVLGWAGFGLVQAIGAGIIAATVYRN